MWQLLTDPNAFFSRRADDSNVLLPVVIVSLAAVANIASFLVLMPHISNSLSDNISPFLVLINTVGAFSGFISVYLVWGLFSAVFYGLSTVFNGEGSFRETVLLAGWGFVPMILAGLISTVATAHTISMVVLPSDPQSLQTFLQKLRQRPAFRVVSVLGILLSVWRGFLWTFAVKHARNLSLRESAIVVGIPVGISVSWTILQYL